MPNRWDPFHELTRVSDKLASRGAREPASFRPAVDIFEDANAIYVKAELAGLQPQDVKVSVDNNVLSLSGERKLVDIDEEKNGYHRIERAYGHFSRSFALHEGVDADAIGAEYKDGLLTLTLPKAKAPTSKSIDVQVA